MKTYKFAVLALVASLGTALPPESGAQVGAVATGVVLSKLMTDVNQLIERARNEGDYLLAKAGVQARDALDAWQKSNSQLLDKAFTELDKASYENFQRAQQLVSNANAGLETNINSAQLIADQANLIVESVPIPGQGRKTYVLRFSPRVAPPQIKPQDDFVLTIAGILLDEGDPVLVTEGGNARRDLVGPLEARFTMPAGEIPQDPAKITVHAFKLKYSTPSESWFGNLFGKRVEVVRELPVAVLPKQLGSYEVQATRTYEKRYEEQFSVMARDQFKGRKRDVPQVVNPKPGYKWDTTRQFTVTQHPGKAAHCHAAPKDVSENGITLVAWVGEIRDRDYLNGADGYINCSVVGTVYRMVKTSEAVPSQSGMLSWTQDTQVSLPSDTSEVSVTVTTFDGRKRIFSGTGTDQFFDVQRTPKSLLIVPKVPSDLR